MTVEFKYVVPNWDLIGPIYKTLPTSIQNNILRAAVGPALAPPMRELKRRLKADVEPSPRSYGVTKRSLIKLTRTSKNKRSVYGLVGPMYGYSERHKKTGFETHIRKRQKGQFVFRNGKKYKMYKEEQKYFRGKATRRSKKKDGGMEKRSPSRYYHLYDVGTKKGIKGKQTLVKAANASKNESLRIFGEAFNRKWLRLAEELRKKVEKKEKKLK